MKTIRKSVVLAIAAIAAAATLTATVPAATAGEEADAVASSRSFPGSSAVRRDFLAESTATEVEEDSNWGSAEEMNIPKTKSTAEKEAEAAAQAAAEAQARAQAAARRGTAASRSTGRTSLSTSSNGSGSQSTTTAAPDPVAAGSVTAFAVAIANNDAYGYGGCTPPTSMDCSCFVQYVFAQYGISLPRTSGAQATVGRPVASLAEAQPGDILANSGHSAIYLGNGMMVDAGNSRVGIVVRPVGFMSGSAIRRVL